MSLLSQIVDGLGRGFSVKVTGDHELVVAEGVPCLPKQGIRSRLRYFTQITTGMNIDGSVTPQEFDLATSQPGFDIKIMGISIFIADSSVDHSKFGDIPALANGWDLKIREAGEDLFLINKAQTGGEVIAQAGGARPFGSDATSFTLSKVTAITDAQLVWIPIREYVPNGIRIGRGTEDKLMAIVNDDLTGLTEFSVTVFGYSHFPEGL